MKEKNHIVNSVSLVVLLWLIGSYSHTESKVTPKDGEVFTSAGNWVVLLNYKQNAALAFVNPSQNSADKPQLDLSCCLPDKGRSYDMSLLKAGGFQTEDPQAIYVKVQVDDNSPFSLEWYPSKDRLITGSPIWLVNEMIEGKLIHLKYRDKAKLKEYSYNITGLGEALDLMKDACKYEYTSR